MEENKLKKHSNSPTPGAVIKWFFACVIIGIFTFLTMAFRWGMSTWGNLSLDEIYYHLSAGFEGSGSDMFLKFIFLCVVIPAAVLIIFIILLNITRKGSALRTVLVLAFLIIPIAAFAHSFYTAWQNYNVTKFIENRTTASEFIEANYADPEEIPITFPEKKRNLIFIYLESMEMTSSDKGSGGYMEESYIPELTALALENECFAGNKGILNGAYSQYNTTWTVGAMFGMTSGLPLTISIANNDMASQEHFAPTITTLGDILLENGYTNHFMCGSVGTFGGRTLYLREHGSYEILDYLYAADHHEIPKDHYVWWGYEDLYLFENAKAHLTELSASGRPFNYTMLTVDTHFPKGYKCEKCDDRFGDNQYANVISCSDRQCAEFVEWIKQQDFYENTTVVLIGDHATMDPGYCDSVSDDYTRKVYVSVLNPAVSPKKKAYRTYGTFDIFPTTLAALGADIKGDRLGLGTNLFSDRPTLSEEMGYEELDEELTKSSEFMKNIMAIDESSVLTLKYTHTENEEGVPGFLVEFSNVKEDNDYEYVYLNITSGTEAVYPYDLYFEKQGPGYYTIFIPDDEVPAWDISLATFCWAHYANGAEERLMTYMYTFKQPD